jgi:uncharacterized membrane protein
MQEILLVVGSWIHVFAAVVWIGGIFFILFVALPGAKETLLSHNLSEITHLNSLWSQILSLKIVIALTMTGIHFYRGLVLTPKLSKLTAEGGQSKKVSSFQKLSLTLVKVNFLIGLTVLLLTGILYAYRS